MPLIDLNRQTNMHVGLHRKAIAHLVGVADVNHRAVHLLDREIVQRCAQCIFRLANLLAVGIFHPIATDGI